MSSPVTSLVTSFVTSLDTASTVEQIRAALPELSAIDVVLFVLMPPLLAVYAFFSFIETTYFALTPAERLALRRV